MYRVICHISDRVMYIVICMVIHSVMGVVIYSGIHVVIYIVIDRVRFLDSYSVSYRVCIVVCILFL